MGTMNILVTGGYGFIGSSFVNLFKILYPKANITIVDKLTYAGDINNVNVAHNSIIKDICDITREEVGEVDYIINFAAESHVDNSILNGKPFIKTNVEGTFNLLEIARNTPSLKKFIQISTDEVYGDLDMLGIGQSSETDALHPSSYYSSTKASADLLVISAAKTYGLRYLITRTCNNYGTHQHKEKFLPTIKRSIMEGNSIPVYGDGNQVREWIWVNDNAYAIIELMMTQEGIWNIGTGDTWRNIDIINYLGDFHKIAPNVNFVADRLGHDRRYELNSSKLHSTISFTPSMTLNKYLEEFL
jgi:dTDP-glucose 4,6-dehydratase